jgi:YgiT-type zinc finger domain-containing protein/excisionase family DNA binding protein
MKEKKWTDCPNCGGKGSMVSKRSIRKEFPVKGYDTVSFRNLDGYVCSLCGETIFSRKSDRMIDVAVAESKARGDSKKYTASEIIPVDELATKWNVSRQRIHQMIREGKIPFVFVGRVRMPLRKALATRRAS